MIKGGAFVKSSHFVQMGGKSIRFLSIFLQKENCFGPFHPRRNTHHNDTRHNDTYRNNDFAFYIFNAMLIVAF
jgi:hypothetical protein